MRRGFKALAERSALAARKALGLGPIDAINAWDYATHRGVFVAPLDSLELSAETTLQLTQRDPASWSAMTLKEGNVTLIVVNPAHAPTRQCNDLMHELAHVELEHRPVRVDVSESGLMILSDYSDEHELEADWYAGALLVPRDGLIQQRGGGATVAQIAQYYGVSEALCTWRLRMTGVDVQLRRRRF